MKGSRALVRVAIACALAGAIAAGCGSSRRDPFAKPQGNDAQAPGPEVTDATVFADAPGPDPFCKGIHCTSDLHKLVDCAGNVQSECPADQGCTLGGCLPACEAAKVNKSSVGCEYYVVQPDVILAAAGGCFAATIANTWSTPVTIGVERDGVALDPTTFGYIPNGSGPGLTYTPLTSPEIPPGQVAIFFLSQAPSLVPGTACPPNVKAALTVDGALHGTGVGRAFRFTSTAPVVAFDMFPFGGAAPRRSRARRCCFPLPRGTRTTSRSTLGRRTSSNNPWCRSSRKKTQPTSRSALRRHSKAATGSTAAPRARHKRIRSSAGTFFNSCKVHL